MNSDILFFFRNHMEALPLYEKLEKQLLREIPKTTIKVSKTQIAFSCRRGYAYVSFLPVRQAKDRPSTYITVTFGLSYRKDSPRIDAATEPYPTRWTHHVLVSDISDLDEELMDWLREAAAFSAAKR